MQKYKANKHCQHAPPRTDKLQRCEECEQLKPEQSFWYRNRKDNRVCGACNLRAPMAKRNTDKHRGMKRGYKKNKISKRKAVKG